MRKNDPVDIRCGDPYFLGYDFFVEDKDVNEIIDFIKETLKKHKQPFMSINTLNVDYECKLWNKEMIEECIKKGY